MQRNRDRETERERGSGRDKEKLDRVSQNKKRVFRNVK